MSQMPELFRVLEQKSWRFAKTMPDNPHFYSLRREWSSDEWFDAAVEMIRSTGETVNFYGREYQVVHCNGWKYWTMFGTAAEQELINRTRSILESPYDKVAGGYDARYQDDLSLGENEEVTRLLGRVLKGSVLDIGSGTGLLLDLLDAYPDRYVGIEPSHEMARLHQEKHEGSEILHCKAEHFYAVEPFDHVVSLFGAASYVNPGFWNRIHGHVNRLLKPGGSWFLMFYRQGYTPDIFAGEGAHPHLYRWDGFLPRINLGTFTVWRGTRCQDPR